MNSFYLSKILIYVYHIWNGSDEKKHFLIFLHTEKPCNPLSPGNPSSPGGPGSPLSPGEPRSPLKPFTKRSGGHWPNYNCKCNF